jgi:hypothetical protein
MNLIEEKRGKSLGRGGGGEARFRGSYFWIASKTSFFPFYLLLRLKTRRSGKQGE